VPFLLAVFIITNGGRLKKSPPRINILKRY